MKNKLLKALKNEQITLVITLVVLCVALTFLSDKFLSLSNFKNILRQSSQYAICAIGMTLVILLGGIDLSVGSIQAFAGIAAVYFLNATGSIFVAVVAGILAGAIVGLINSLIITKMHIAPLICTLGTMSIVSGLALVITKAVSIPIQVKEYVNIGMGAILGIPVPVIILIVLIAVFYFVLNHTVFGRYIYAIGGNKESAKLAGIPVDKVMIWAYVISGALAGLSAVILSSRMGSGQPSAGVGFEMTVIAAVIIGGVSMSGGKGSLIGAMLGMLTLYVLTNGLVLLNVTSFWQDIVRGALIVLAVFIDLRRQAKEKKRLLKAKIDNVKE